MDFFCIETFPVFVNFFCWVKISEILTINSINRLFFFKFKKKRWLDPRQEIIDLGWSYPTLLSSAATQHLISKYKLSTWYTRLVTRFLGPIQQLLIMMMSLFTSPLWGNSPMGVILSQIILGRCIVFNYLQQKGSLNQGCHQKKNPSTFFGP